MNLYGCASKPDVYDFHWNFILLVPSRNAGFGRGVISETQKARRLCGLASTASSSFECGSEHFLTLLCNSRSERICGRATWQVCWINSV